MTSRYIRKGKKNQGGLTRIYFDEQIEYHRIIKILIYKEKKIYIEIQYKLYFHGHANLVVSDSTVYNTVFYTSNTGNASLPPFKWFIEIEHKVGLLFHNSGRLKFGSQIIGDKNW